MIYTPITRDQVQSTRQALYEVIPITGTLVSGTYGNWPNDTNVQKFTGSHGLFETVYDYPYLSSSANQIFDITFGVRSGSLTPVTQSSEKNRIYKQMAQTLLGFDVTGNVKNFYVTTSSVSDNMLFINFSRLLTKDGIKIGTFTGSMKTSSFSSPSSGTPAQLTDNSTGVSYNTVNNDSPVGQYWYIYTGSAFAEADKVGMLFYQQGVLALDLEKPVFTNFGCSGSAAGILSGSALASTGTITEVADGFRRYINNIQFQNTVQVHSTIYNCSIGLNQYNYSSNITYTSASQIVVKNSIIDTPITYITTIGLYDDSNQLLAVAKTSEPLRKTSADSINIRVRLDY